MNRVSQLHIQKLKAFHGDEGSLVPIEEQFTVPFKIERVFYVYNVKNQLPRGNHAHRECTQALICLHGECEVVCDDSLEKRSFQLKDPTDMLIIPPEIWAEETYLTEGTVLMVLCDQHFNENEYLRDPVEYRTYLKNKYKLS